MLVFRKVSPVCEAYFYYNMQIKLRIWGMLWAGIRLQAGNELQAYTCFRSSTVPLSQFLTCAVI